MFVYKAEVLQRWFQGNTDYFSSDVDPTELIWPHIQICEYEGRLIQLTNQFKVDYSVKDVGMLNNAEIKDFISKKDQACYHIDVPEDLQFADTAKHTIRLMFNASIPIKALPQLSLKIGRKNSPDLDFRWDDNSYLTTLNPNVKTVIRIKEKRIKHLSGRCRKEPVYQLMVEKFLESEIDCPSKCRVSHWPFEYDKRLLDLDECSLQSEEFTCMRNWEQNFLSMVKKLCLEIGFTGNIQHKPHDDYWCDKVNVRPTHFYEK